MPNPKSGVNRRLCRGLSEGLQPSIVELIADVIWCQMEEKGVKVLLGK